LGKVKLIAASLVLILSSSCNNSSNEAQLDVVDTLNSYSKIIASRDLDQLHSICTPNGFDSMMDWTDSLRKDKIVDEITTTFSQKRILYSQSNDSVFMVSTSQYERPLPGGSIGRVMLKSIRGQLKIDAYEGGFSVVN
jgi:hypothetical protein